MLTLEEEKEYKELRRVYKSRSGLVKKVGLWLNKLIAEENDAKSAFQCYQGYLVATKRMTDKEVNLEEV